MTVDEYRALAAEPEDDLDAAYEAAMEEAFERRRWDDADWWGWE